MSSLKNIPYLLNQDQLCYNTINRTHIKLFLFSQDVIVFSRQLFEPAGEFLARKNNNILAE
ncbi:MAG: hypothetical protein V1688_03820 [bacterium]